MVKERELKGYKMKKIIALCGMALFFCSCAGVHVKQPEIGNVKKIAVVSVASNEEYKDIEEVEGKKENLLLTAVGNVLKDNVEIFTEGQKTVVSHGANELNKMFDSVDGWEAIPFGEVINNEDVKETLVNKDLTETLKDIFTRDRFIAPEGLGKLPYEAVKPNGIHYVNGERVEVATLRSLGKLCQSLNVDAVVVAEFLFAYKRGMMTKITGNVTPIVTMNVAVVDKDGNLVLYTDRGWEQLEGDQSAKYANSVVDMHRDASVDAYKRAADLIVEAFKKKATAKLSEK